MTTSQKEDSAALFNQEPLCGLEAAGFLSDVNVEAVADYLRSHKDLSPKVVGEFIGGGSSLSQKVLGGYVRSFHELAGDALGYMASLRLFFESFRPVGESQFMDRYIHAWVAHYLAVNTHPERGTFASHYACVTLTWSVIMLNVDHHSPVLADRPKLTLVQYTRNLESANEGSDFPEPFLQAIYGEVRDKEFKIIQRERKVSDMPLYF